MELATLVDKGEITGLAYVAECCTGAFLVNCIGSLAAPGQIPRTRQMIDTLYEEACHLETAEFTSSPA